MEKEKEMAKKYYWLKLKDNFFNQKEVKKLRRIAGGDTYTIIYLKMQLLSIKKDGIIEFEGTEKDLAEQLSYEIDENLDNIQVTLSFLKANNLIEEISENNFLLTKVPDCIGKEGASAERVRRHRERKALLEKEKEQKMLQCNGEVTNSNNAVIKSNTEIEKEKEIEIEKEIETTTIYNTNNIVREENGNSSSGSSSGDLEILKIAEQRIFILSPIQMEQIITDVKQYSFNEVSKALEIADNNGKHTYSYVKGILERRRAGDKDSGEPRKTSKWNYTIPKARELTEEEKRRAAEELD